MVRGFTAQDAYIIDKQSHVRVTLKEGLYTLPPHPVITYNVTIRESILSFSSNNHRFKKFSVWR